MRNKLKIISCLMLVMLCVTSISVPVFASDKEPVLPDEELGTETDTSASDETETDSEIPYSTIDENEKSPLAFTPDGNLTLIDDFLQIESNATEDTEQIEKQFITVQSKNGNTFYLVIDRNGETENVYFMNLVDEADLTALIEGEDGNTAVPACTCTDKCAVGAINTNCEVCRSNMSECIGKEAVADPEPDESNPNEEPVEEQSSANFLPVILIVVAGAAGGAVYWFKFRKPKVKTSGDSDPDDYDYGQDDDDYDEETEIDDADVMAEAESEDTER